MRKSKASASITVLIMTMVIILIGLSFVFISKTNYVLSKKNNSWLMDYYLIEGEINEDIAALENYLKDNNVESIEHSTKEDLNNLIKSEISFDEGDYPAVEGYKPSSVTVELYIDDTMLEDFEIKSHIGIRAEILYSYKDQSFVLKSKYEIPPSMEYESLN